MIYLEELQRGQEFIEIAKEITGGGPSQADSGDQIGAHPAPAPRPPPPTPVPWQAPRPCTTLIFEQSGIIRVESIDELFDFAIAFAYKNENALGKMRRKVPHGNRVAIVTNAGGPGIVATT